MRPLLLVTAAVLALCRAASAQSSNVEQARLELKALDNGTVFRARVWSTEIGAPAAILFGQAGVFLPLAKPPLLIDPNGAQVARSVIGGNGLYEMSVLVPPGTLPSGATVFAQAFVQASAGLVASERLASIADANQNAAFGNASAALPAATQDLAGLDADAIDFDRDGDLDLCVTTDDRCLLLVNDGGGFSDQTDVRLDAMDNQGSRDVEWGDVDQDGDFDLLLTGGVDPHNPGTSYTTSMFRNDGAGFFAKDLSFPSTPLFISDGAFGDLDGDGDLDLVLATFGAKFGVPQGNGLLLNLGGRQGGVAGAFLRDLAFEQAAWNDNLRDNEGLALGDLDRDGDLDLIFARSDTGGAFGSGPGDANVLLLNDGAGAFTDASATHLPAINGGEGDNTNGLALADVNGDGYLDVVGANSHGSVAAYTSGDLLMNLGAAQPGRFTNASNLLPDLSDSVFTIVLGATAGDIDLDGDTDLVLNVHEFFGGAGLVGGPQLFVNQGGAQGGVEGTFLRDLGFFAGFGTFICPDGVFFDADGDGDLEYYAVAQGGIVDPTKTQDKLGSGLLR